MKQLTILTMGSLIVALGLTTGIAETNAGTSIDVKEVECDDDEGIQKLVDDADKPTIIFIEGVCVEDVTINKDDVTLSGNESGSEPGPGGTGTIQGTINIVGADRVGIEFLTITGSGEGIIVRETASANITSNSITNNTKGGVLVFLASHAGMTDNMVTDNGQPSPFFDCGLFVGGGSTVFSTGNTYSGNGFCAVEVDRNGYFRNGFFIVRNQGIGPDPADLDVYIQNGCEQGDAPGCGAGGSVALEVFNGGNMDLRNADATGFIEVSVGSHLRVKNMTISGNIDASVDSLVRLENRTGTNPPVLTNFTGQLTCSGDSQVYFSPVQCSQICAGDVTACSFPECNDGVDNELIPDGDVDFPADAECDDLNDNDESS